MIHKIDVSFSEHISNLFRIVDKETDVYSQAPVFAMRGTISSRIDRFSRITFQRITKTIRGY